MPTPGELPGPSVFEDGTVQKTDLVPEVAQQIDEATADLASLIIVAGTDMRRLDCGRPGDTPQIRYDCGSP